MFNFISDFSVFLIGVDVVALNAFFDQGIGFLGGGLAAVGALQIINGITTVADNSDDVNPADKKKGYKTIAAGGIMAAMGIALVPVMTTIFNFGP